MSNSSAPLDYSITSISSTDTITIDSSSWTMQTIPLTNTISTITLTGGGSGYTSATGTTGSYTISGSTGGYTSATGTTGSYTISGSTGGYTIGSIDSTPWSSKKEFVDCLPSFSRIEAMCKEYPGLAIAFEKFKTTYYLVKDEYDNPKDKK